MKQLGIDTIWLAPVYPHSNDDGGYDIIDQCQIGIASGTMEDWERLRDQMHKRNMKLCMDIVVNHTSDEHPWFQKSRASKDNNPYRDYYIWKPSKNGQPPTNWESVFGGSAWEYDETTREYLRYCQIVLIDLDIICTCSVRNSLI